MSGENNCTSYLLNGQCSIFFFFKYLTNIDDRHLQLERIVRYKNDCAFAFDPLRTDEKRTNLIVEKAFNISNAWNDEFGGKQRGNKHSMTSFFSFLYK